MRRALWKGSLFARPWSRSASGSPRRWGWSRSIRPGTLIAAALLLGVVNAFVRPIIIILTLPITLLTLGLFLLVINALMIMLVAWLVPGFLVAGFWSAVFAAIVVSLTSWVMSGWIGPRGRVEVMTIHQPGGRGRW